MKWRKVLVLSLAFVLIGWFFNIYCLAGYKLDKGRLMRELTQAGYRVIGEGERDGTPYVEIILPIGKAIFNVCRDIPCLNADFFKSRDSVGRFNKLNPFYPRIKENKPFQALISSIKIPLNSDGQVFPEFEEKLAGFERYIVVDLGREYLALYSSGRLFKYFTISPGAIKRRTPIVKFRVLKKEKGHYSRKYNNAWMPWSLQIYGDYFIHGGVLPGVPDSHGCVRLLTEDAKELFQLVEVGTPGEVTRYF